MKKVRLIKLSLTNFKGIKSFEAVFNGTTKIYGDNATGKTTLVDAFTWLLFGKDSTGRKEFSIKTYDKENHVIHKLDHEVTGIFEVDGEEMNLKRVFREKWVTRRGSSEPELQGHETLFFWNDVPMQAKEYQAKVDQVISEDTFRMLTSPFYFNTLKWQERRNILTSIAGDVSDIQILDSMATLQNKDEILALTNILNSKKTLDEYKKELSAKKKKLKEELKLIPARVDEVTRNTPEIKDWASIASQIELIENEINTIDEKLQDASKISESLFREKQNRQQKIHHLKTRISDIEFEGRQKFSNQTKEKTTAISNAKSEIEKIQLRIKTAASEVKNIQERIESYKEAQNKLREEWMKVNAEEFPGFGDSSQFKCPTCGQELPADVVENKKTKIRANFNADKERRLDEINRKGQGYKLKIENAQKEIGQLQSIDHNAQIQAQEEIIKGWEVKRLESVQSILSGNIEYEQAKKELSGLESQPEPEATKVDNSELKTRKSELINKLDSLKRDQNLKFQIESADNRKNQLLDDEKKYSQQLSELEQTEFSIEQFTRAKVDMLESRINGMFEGVKFRMFDEQLNGGLIECCDTLVNTNGAWVPWADGNNAGRLNAGIEIINVLSSFYGQVAPIWIDNSESVTNIKTTDAQFIELYVSEQDKTLRIA